MWAACRAAAQLLVVGWALTLVLDPSASVAWSWLWVVAMIGVAGLTIRNRAREVPGIWLLGHGLDGGGGGGEPVGDLRVRDLPGRGADDHPPRRHDDRQLDDRVRRSSAAGSSGELRDKRPEVEARLALGHPWPDAARPYVREAMRTALIPQIESTKAVGLVFLPGAMTGLILAGVDPLDAVKVQLAIMYLILGSVATSVTVIGLGLARRLFTPDHRLRRLERVAT